MHCAALTHDNKILTWGINDLDALGRDIVWDGGLVDMNDNNADSGAELNPKEATPTIIDTSNIPEGTVFTQLVASDNATFALTNDGLVYGWGTIRVSLVKTCCLWTSHLYIYKQITAFLDSRQIKSFKNDQYSFLP
jgi:regulator of chromosome condensation